MRIKSLVLPGVAAIAVAVLALSLGHQRSAPATVKPSATVTTKSGHVTVAISNYAFKPVALTIKTGTKVTWTNSDATAHTATADQASFDTGTVGPASSKTVDFKRPGTYTYHCAFHAFMTATVKVVG